LICATFAARRLPPSGQVDLRVHVAVVDLRDDGEHRNLEQDRVEPRAADRDVDFPVGARDRLDADEAFVELEEAEKIDEIALEEAPGAEVGKLLRRELEAAKLADLGADLGDVGSEVHVRVAALEAVLDLCARKVMQDHLHHRELVEVGVEQRRDDHAGTPGVRLSRGP
jgi:hypothetical protein